MLQRILDFVLSSLALLVLAPLLVPIVILLRFTGEGEIFYRQHRVGKGGKPINLFKFATMLKDSPKIGSGTVTVKNDPRVLPVGKLLRRTKINELPQLLNIWLGDMSVVGPRPQTQRCFDAFPKLLQPAISSVKPGLSGVGSIVFRDEENILADHSNSLQFYDDVIAPYKGELEAYYVEKQTLWMYFLVVFLTAWVVVFPSSTIVWKVFPDLPTPPTELESSLNYCLTR